MRGRSRGNIERIITLAHQTEAMARQKTLKPLDRYLTKAKKVESAQVDGATSVLAMLKRMKAKQDSLTGSGKG